MRYNTTYLEMLNTTLTTPSFYYSHTYDLSHNMQSLDETTPDFLRVINTVIYIQKFRWFLAINASNGFDSKLLSNELKLDLFGTPICLSCSMEVVRISINFAFLSFMDVSGF